jgi:hypothetical protein
MHVGLYEARKRSAVVSQTTRGRNRKNASGRFQRPSGPARIAFRCAGAQNRIPGGSLSVGRIGWSFAMSMIRRFGVVASLLFLAFAPAAPATAGRIDEEARPQPFVLYCFNRYTGAFLYWGMCAGYQFPCRPQRAVTWRYPNYFMPHYCSPEDERRAA